MVARPHGRRPAPHRSREGPAGARARPRRLGDARHRQLPDVVPPGGGRRLHPRHRPPAFVRLRGSAQGLRGRRPAGPAVWHRVLGRRHDLLPPDLGAAHRGRPGRRTRGGREGGGGRSEDRPGAGLHRGHRRVLPRARPARAGARLPAGHGGRVAPLSRRRRGRDLPRPDPAGHGAAERHDLRQPEEGGRGAEPAAAAASRPPRHRPLRDPLLRLPGPRQRGAAGGARVREDRPLVAARAPHAVAHLHASRPLAGVDRLEHRLRGGGPAPRRPDPSRRRVLRHAPRPRLPRVRVPAGRRPGEGSRGAGGGGAGEDVRRAELRRRLRARGRARALGARAAGLEGGRGPGGCPRPSWPGRSILTSPRSRTSRARSVPLTAASPSAPESLGKLRSFRPSW